MNLASYLCFAFVLIIQANAQGVTETLDKVKLGIEAGNDILGILSPGGNSQNFGKISQIADKLSPFLGALGPAISIISLFLPNSPSDELLVMKREFAKIDAKFDQVFNQFEEVKNLIQEASLKSQYGEYARTILSLSNKLQLYLNKPYGEAETFKRAFISEYENSYGGATFKLLNGMMSESTFSDNIPLTAMNITKNHRRKTQEMMKGVVTLIMQGVKVVIAYHKLKEDEAGAIAMKMYWEGELKKLIYHVIDMDIKVLNRWYSQLGIDIDNMLKSLNGKSNAEFANRLYSFVNEKYYWRDWHVVAYNELKGGSRHWIKHCDGYHRFRKYGRNLVVSSVVKSKKRLNWDVGAGELEWTLKENCWRDWLGITRCIGAHDMYKALPRELREGCTYAGVGVIEKGADIAHKAHRHALYRRMVRVINDIYMMHAFG